LLPEVGKETAMKTMPRRTVKQALPERGAKAHNERPLLLLDLVSAVNAVAHSEAETLAVLEYMLAAGHFRFVGQEALAA
jgi:hypothetical protein